VGTAARSDWSEETEQHLRDAGWTPGRHVPTDDWEAALREHGGFETHPAARKFLAEFGGLAVNVSGPGQNMARQPFRLDPTAAEHEDEMFTDYGEEIGKSLYPVGQLGDGGAYLAIDENGAVYWFMDNIGKLGDTAREALDALVRGVQRYEPLWP
jgi:SUKH-3 immunity protein